MLQGIDHCHVPSCRRGFLGGSDCKESTWNMGDLGSILGSGSSPGGGHGNPLQCSWLENPHGQGYPGGLESMGSQRVRQNWATKRACTCVRTPTHTLLWEKMECWEAGRFLSCLLPAVSQRINKGLLVTFSWTHYAKMTICTKDSLKVLLTYIFIMYCILLSTLKVYYIYFNCVFLQFSSVQSLSRVWLFATPCTAARQASLLITSSWRSPKPMSIQSMMHSDHLIIYLKSG